ncbi:MAG: sialidase family protein [Anaerolineales bacterium]
MTRTNHWLSAAALVLVALSLFEWAGASAQVQDEDWSEPYQLSSPYGEATGAVMLSDSFGLVHVFWAESGFDHQRSLIYYATYDGESWSMPADIYASWPGTGIDELSGVVDKEGYLHLVWSEGVTGPLMYSKAEISEASSARSWQQPIRIDVAAARLELAVDEAGLIHIVYADFGDQPIAAHSTAVPQPGIYYFFSENQGKTWTYPTWLDPDIPPAAVPSWLDMAVDEQDGIHLVWSYNDEASQSEGRWVRYSHSLDGGETWLDPFSVDYADEEVDELRLAHPGIVVRGEQVHLVWSGNSDTEREHRVSLDRGLTWSETELIFDGLEGQAIGDGLGTDGLGRVHFVGQIRWPMAIYHAVWESASWSEPSMVYLIREDSNDEPAGRIGAHRVRLVVHNGNQLVMTFTTEPSSPQSVLYAMQASLDGVPETVASALPGAQVVETQAQTTPAPTDQAEPTAEPSGGGPEIFSGGEVVAEPPPISALWIGVMPALILAISIVAFRILRSR